MMEDSSMCKFHQHLSKTIDVSQREKLHHHHHLHHYHQLCHTSTTPLSTHHQHFTLPGITMTTSLRLLILLFLFLLLSFNAASAQSSTCTDAAGCFPPVGNLALGRTINASSTCTENEIFCLLFVQECAVCSPIDMHSASSLNDNDNSTFWVSEIGPNVQEVTLQLDFEGPVFFQDMTIVWISLGPLAMTLERSCDYGATWSVYRYYAIDCASSFMMMDTYVSEDPNMQPFNGTTPICTTAQSGFFISDLDFGDQLMTFSASQHVPLNDQESDCYQTITNIRVVMLDVFPEARTSSNSSFQFYGMREWIVRGSCACNGHAGTCIPRQGEPIVEGKEVYSGCMCQHNTVLPRCDGCLNGFNNRPFLPGTVEEANICESCMCNGHATDCQPSQMVSTTSSVCINCTDNTSGDQCSECIPGFYQDTSLLLNDPNICTACGCSPAGIIDDGSCDSQGQCNCKSNVVSLRCEECQDGYFNLSASNPDGCQLCDCSLSGSLLNNQGLPRCNDTSGECLCRPTVEGEQCNLCQPGSYDISSGCPACECDFGGSISSVCDQDSPNGQCFCKANIQGTLCNIPVPGYYFQTLDSFIYEAEDILSVPADYILLPVDDTYGSFTGSGFLSLPPDFNAVFDFSPPRDSQYEIIVRFSTRVTATISASFTISSLTPTDLSLNCSSVSPSSNDSLSYTGIELSFTQFNQGYHIVDSLCLSSSNQYQFSVSYSGNSASQPLLDSVVLFPDVSVTSDFFSASTGQPVGELIPPCLPRSASNAVVDSIQCEGVSFTLITEFLGDDPLLDCDCDIEGTVNGNESICSAFGGGCDPCQPGVTGRRCDTCLNGYYQFSINGCEDCACDATGSTSPICSPLGQCPCKPGIGGTTCNDCLPGHFNFTSEGCTPCECSEYATTSSCNVTTGQCSCPERVTGRTCNECSTNSFNLTVQGCQSCDCDDVGSAGGGCDVITGQCECTGVLVGPRCDQCSDRFFNTGGDGGREICVPCVCSGRSDICSLNSMPSSLSVLRQNFSEMCSNDSSRCGEGWSIVATDGTPISFGPSDSNGLSYFISFNMMPMVFVSDVFLGDNQEAYGLNFSVSIAIISTAPIKSDGIFIRLQSSEFTTSLVGYPFIESAIDEFNARTLLSFTISLVESNWYFEDSTRNNPSLLEFLSFLSNITLISFTAEYTEDFIEFIYLREVELLFVSSEMITTPLTTTISTTYPVEDCTCPPAYQGSSCELCARGFARPTGSIAAPCIMCDCNSQTLDCDSDTMVCLNCGDNTIGDNCELCQDGFYGDPTLGIPCLPCECPRPDNSFSPTCFLNVTDGLPTCDSCTERYMGRNCEICSDGYFGNPLVGRCIDCMCNGNVDPALGPVCDMTTGRCMNCLNNTEGFECDLCQFGYFGDPSTNTACQECPCDVRGTDGHCDTLFGTCNCLPNVMGETCDTCMPGFFNITPSVGCVECNCDPRGSTGQNCDQDSGDCLCLPNVGSVQDNKCGMCTPGYFNFTEGVGCEACGCSELAVSSTCDADTGRCECQEGAVGIKCNDCAFGFTGQVPNCEQCHDCYFQWSEIIGNFTVRVDALQLSIDTLVSTYYSGHTEDTLNGEISILTEQLAQVNRTLNSITLEESDVEELGIILNELNATLTTFTNQLADIQGGLVEAEAILETVNAFDGVVNMTDVMELMERLTALNITAAALSSLANESLAQLEKDERTISSAWTEIVDLNLSAEEITANLTEGLSRVDPIMSLIEDTNNTYMQLRDNLTRLDVRADELTSQLVRVRERINDTVSSVIMANASSASILEEVRRRQADVVVLFSLLRDLNDSAVLVEIASLEARDSAENLMEAARQTVTASNNTLTNISLTLSNIENITANLTEAKAIARNISAIRLPSLEYAQSLADRITSSIIPDEVVVRIMEDAQSSRERADQALELAQNASSAVMSASDLVATIQSDIVCTNTTQLQEEDLLLVVQQMIFEAQDNIELVSSLVSELEELYSSAPTTCNVTFNLINEATDLGLTNRMAATELLNQASGNATEAEEYRNDFLQAQGDLENLTRETDSAANDAMALFEGAQTLSDEVEALKAEAITISIQDITSLLQEYKTELEAASSLEKEIVSLTSELEGLIDTFTTTSERLQRCYQSDTP